MDCLIPPFLQIQRTPLGSICNREVEKGQVAGTLVGSIGSTLQMFSAGLQAPYRDFGVQVYQNCRGYVQHGSASNNH